MLNVFVLIANCTGIMDRQTTTALVQVYPFCPYGTTKTLRASKERSLYDLQLARSLKSPIRKISKTKGDIPP